MIYNMIFDFDEHCHFEKTIKEVLDKVASSVEISDAELSIKITDNEGITEYNEKYRELKGATDVLSFPFDGENPEGGNYLGDIIISMDRVVSQAKELGHSTEKELMKLSVHGFLHLMGYDHKDDDNSMEKIELEITGI